MRQIVDPHFHFIDGAHSYLPDDLMRDVAGVSGITDLIFVECNFRWGDRGSRSQRALEETRAVAQLAQEVKRAGGPDIWTIGYVDLRDPEVDALLTAQADISGGRLKGIRNISTWHLREDLRNTRMNPPQGLVSDPDFLKGAQVLADHGLPLDLWSYSEQLGEVRALAREIPSLTIVLNHLGGPIEIATGEVVQDWRREMESLAALPNIRVKIGGIGMPVFGFGFQDLPARISAEDMVAAWKPHVLETIQRFGAGNCMFESNFPVDRAAISYSDLWRAFEIMAADLSDEDQVHLFGKTAARVYLGAK